MSSRLGQTIQRYNAAMSSANNGNAATSPENSQQGLQNDCSSGGDAPPVSSISTITGSSTATTTPQQQTATSVGSTTSTVASVINTSTNTTAHSNHPHLYQHHAAYKGHRGHRRGHSYGGVISPPHQGGIHHSQLEARPSHPNTAHPHGILPSSSSSQTASNWQKGHRRALSGCLPPTMGAVAWSSLRDLDAADRGTPLHSGYHHTPPLRSLSPDALDGAARTDPGRARPLSPDVVLQTGGKCSPLSPQASVDAQDLRRKKSVSSECEKRLTSSGGKRKGSGGSLGKQAGFEKQLGLLHDSSLDSMECGLGPCRLPQCFQQLANIKFFVFILAILVTLQQAVASGYVNSVITTIESRFEIPSRFVGMVASAYEMGNVITVMFVSYLGAKRHIPRWIAVGVLVMVVGCVVFTLPEFLTPRTPGHGDGDAIPLGSVNLLNSTRYSSGALALSSLRPDMRNGICHSANPQSSKFISDDGGSVTTGEGGSHHGNDTVYPSVHKEELMLSYGCTVEVVDDQGKTTMKASQEQGYGHPLILFMLAQLLLGCGGSPLFTLGITYVDDHVPADSSSVYIGTIYACAAFGPVLGFLVGAYFLSVPSGSVGPDGKFLGMWWGGYLIAGALLFVACLPFLTFPRISNNKERLEEEEDEEEEEGEREVKEGVIVAIDTGGSIGEREQARQMHQRHDSFREEDDAEVAAATADDPENVGKMEAGNGEPQQYGQSIKDLPKSIWRLITNPTYVVTCLGGCMELNIVSGFVVFLPKYLETQFELGKSQASLFVGGIAIPGACLGIFAGGYLVKRLALKPSGAAKFVLATNILCLLGYVLFFFLGCPNPNLAGGTVPYPTDKQGIMDNNWDDVNLNLTSTCNSECSCDNSMDPQLVCHEGTTYYSPCHAGCAVNLTQCSCAGGASVTPGRCVDSPSPCNTLLPFMIVLFFMTGTVAVTQMPLLMIVLRSVSPEERSFALGMQFVIFRLFGYIPSPIIFGNVIDSACLLWKVKRCSTLLPAVSGRCLLYDIQDFRYKYVGVLSGLKLCALALFLYDFFMLRRIEEREEKEGQGANGEGGNGTGNQKALEGKTNQGSIISLDKLFQESDTCSAMTTLTTTTVLGNPPVATPSSSSGMGGVGGSLPPHPLTSEGACVNVGGNASMMLDSVLQPCQAPPPPCIDLGSDDLLGGHDNFQQRRFPSIPSASNSNAGVPVQSLPGVEHLHVD